MRSCFSRLIRTALPLFLALLAGTDAVAASSVNASGTPIRIGVLAYRGPDEVVSSWGDLPARLAKFIPGYRFEMQLLAGAELHDAVRDGELEFVLTNSSQYVSLAAEFGIQRITTVMLPDALSSDRALGSTILALAGRTELAQLSDLRGKRIAAVASDAFGGYLVAAREFLGAGIDLEAGDARMVFIGFPMRRALDALRAGEADAAIVRTCLLEQLAEKGLLQAGEFKVIGPRTTADFSCATSTPLYPDWPLAVARGVDRNLAKAVAVALLSMPPSPTGLSWDVPAGYQSVNDLYRDLMLGPYIELRSTTFRGLLKSYRPHVLISLSLLIATVIYVIWLIRRHTLELRAARAQTRELQKEAEHMARLSILGEMAGTLAHELNQPLTTIATFAQGLERRCAAGPVDPAMVADANREIVAQTERAANVIRRVRAFTKKRMAVRECKSIGNTVEEAIDLFSNLLPDLPAVTLDDRLPTGAQIEADHLQLQEVMLNLMKNAADAMREQPATEREISIVLAREEGGISITVADRGPAVPAETIAHLFEPFFTTKPDGMGLGLSICRSIAEAHGGRLDVEPRNPPPGLAFRINLPAGTCNGKFPTPPHSRR
jgi:two-component system sensor histidine kinase TtrS